LDGIERGRDEERVEQPKRNRERGNRNRVFRSVSTSFEQLSCRDIEHEAGDQVDDQVGSLEWPWICGPVVGVEQETQQRYRASGRSRKAARQISSQQLDGLYGPACTELLEVWEVVE